MENMLYFGQCVFGHFELLVYLDNVYLDNVLDRLDQYLDNVYLCWTMFTSICLLQYLEFPSIFGQCLLDQYVKYFFMILKHLCTYVAVLNFP